MSLDRLISQLLESLPDARAGFYASGFELPKHYLAAIEATRSRSCAERDYQYYQDEVLREYTALKYPWQPSVRASLRTTERSPYLDMLASRSASEPASASLDPNFNLFVKLDPDAWGKLLGRFRHQKQKELEQHSAHLIAVAGSSRTVVDGILHLAEYYGYSPRRRLSGQEEDAELDGPKDHPVRTALRVSDLPALEKRGHVVVQYFFVDLPTKPFGLDTFVPGGHLYFEWNKSANAVLFAFYAQCRFLFELSNETAKRRR